MNILGKSIDNTLAMRMRSVEYSAHNANADTLSTDNIEDIFTNLRVSLWEKFMNPFNGMDNTLKDEHEYIG